MNELSPQLCPGAEGGQWIPEGVVRPVIDNNNVATYYDGKIVIEFPEAFRVPNDWQSINDKRNLFEQQQMEIVIPPVGIQTKEDLAFDWSIINFTDQFMEIALEFEKPYIIGKEEEPNIMRIYFWDTKMFARASDYVEIPLDTKLDVVLRYQMSSSSKETVDELADTAVTSTSIIFVIILVLKLSLLNQLLSQVRSLSIVTHMMLIAIKLPASVMVFYPKIFEIVAFDIFADHLKFNEVLYWVFKFDDVPF